MINFSTRLKELRNEKMISQLKLAKDLRIDPSTVAKYETGDRQPDLEMLCTLADYFEVSVDYLLGRKEY